jgi:hypothetical protein
MSPNREVIGETVTVYTDDHPKRSDSPTYVAARKFLMGTRRGGCVICGGVPDMTHPEMLPVGSRVGLQDHHGQGIYVRDVLVAFGLFPLEWSQGWGSNPALVAHLVANLNVVLSALGEPTYDAPITDADSLMAYVDSRFNANVKFCQGHHVGLQTQHCVDALGHEAVGIHEIPGPIFWGQMTCDWANFDMWGGTTGTVAVAPATDATGTPLPGQVVVLNAHPDAGVNRGDVLPSHNPVARLAHAGAHRP